MDTRTLVIPALICCAALLFLLASCGQDETGSRSHGPVEAAPDPPATAAPEPPATAAPDPPATTASGPPSDDTLENVDQILARLEFGTIVFNVPATINLQETAIIQLVLGLQTSAAELRRMIEASGETEAARIRVSNRMEARLSGANFAITAVNPEVQAVTRAAVTEWKWEIKPISTGRQRLHLTLSALVNVDGESTPRVIRTFDKKIAVEVTWAQRAGSFIEKNWQWLWAVVLLPVAGWVWRKVHVSRGGAGGSG